MLPEDQENGEDAVEDRDVGAHENRREENQCGEQDAVGHEEQEETEKEQRQHGIRIGGPADAQERRVERNGDRAQERIERRGPLVEKGEAAKAEQDVADVRDQPGRHEKVEAEAAQGQRQAPIGRADRIEGNVLGKGRRVGVDHLPIGDVGRLQELAFEGPGSGQAREVGHRGDGAQALVDPGMDDRDVVTVELLDRGDIAERVPTEVGIEEEHRRHGQREDRVGQSGQPAESR